MALHPDFPSSPHAILDPSIRWFPADEALRDTSMDKLMPPLVAELRKKVKEFRDGGYVGASDTSRSLLTWWFKTPHLLPQADGNMYEFQYFFAQREALETIVYLYDVVGVEVATDEPGRVGEMDRQCSCVVSVSGEDDQPYAGSWGGR